MNEKLVMRCPLALLALFLIFPFYTLKDLDHASNMFQKLSGEHWFFYFSFPCAVRTCPEGYIQFEQACYKYFNERHNKSHAASTCAKDHAFHVDIQTSAENTFVRSLIPTGVHSISTGFKRDASSRFIWDRTSSAGIFTDWRAGEPNNVHGREGCMVVQKVISTVGTWNDIPCTSKHPFICKTSEL